MIQNALVTCWEALNPYTFISCDILFKSRTIYQSIGVLVMAVQETEGHSQAQIQGITLLINHSNSNTCWTFYRRGRGAGKEEASPLVIFLIWFSKRISSVHQRRSQSIDWEPKRTVKTGKRGNQTSFATKEKTGCNYTKSSVGSFISPEFVRLGIVSCRQHKAWTSSQLWALAHVTAMQSCPHLMWKKRSVKVRDQVTYRLWVQVSAQKWLQFWWVKWPFLLCCRMALKCLIYHHSQCPWLEHTFCKHSNIWFLLVWITMETELLLDVFAYSGWRILKARADVAMQLPWKQLQLASWTAEPTYDL